MNETITIPRADYDNVMRTLGRADACVSYLMTYLDTPYSVDVKTALRILGIDIIGDEVVKE